MSESIKDIFHKATKDTCHLFGLNLRTLIFAIAYFIGLFIHYKLYGKTMALDELKVWLSFIFIPFGMLSFAVLLWNIIAAPYRLSIARERKYKSQAKELNERINHTSISLPDALIGNNLRDLDIRVIDLARDNDLVKGRTFENCHFFGPAMMSFLNTLTCVGCEFDGLMSDLIIKLPESRRVIGVIGFEDCTFIKCRFTRIGFIASEAQAKKLISTTKIM